jgi:hypothetical protein
MEIATYIIFSYLLSAIGYGIYRFVIRKRSNAKQQKTVLYAILGLSLLLPLAFLNSAPLFFTEKSHEAIEFHDEPALTKELLACYMRQKAQDGFCHCEQKQQLDLVQFEKNNLYETALSYQTVIQQVSFGIAAFVLILLFIKLLQLIRIIKNSEESIRIINNKKYTILRTEKYDLAASFRLWKGYIVWNPELDKLSQTEQDAILQHEVGHLNHFDTFEQIGLNLIQAAWFFNPIFYVLKKELHLINEFMADAFAIHKIGNKRTYATLILRLKATQQTGFLHHVAQHPIEKRIRHLLTPEPKTNRIPFFLLLTTVLMLTVSWSAAPVINGQNTQFEEYCHLQKENQTTGKAIFCKNCLFEDLNK